MISLALGVLLTCCLDSEVRVAERDIELRLEGGETRAVFPVENGAHRLLPIVVTAELVDPDGVVYGEGSTVTMTRPGGNVVVVDFSRSLTELDAAEFSQVLLYRLRYRVAPVGGAARLAIDALDGIVSISEIARELFELRLVYSEYVQAGRTLRASVVSRHPMTGRAVSGVNVRASMSMADEVLADASETTDRSGLAVLDLEVPASLPPDEAATLALAGFKGPALVDLEEEVYVGRGAPLRLMTDRSLYQPGQTVHLRFLSFDGSKRAIANATGTIRITDHRDELVFATEVTTSRFGIASADWDIPEDVSLGYYFIDAALDEDVWGEAARDYRRIRVSRYDLPEFTVSAAPDREFYLPGEDAEIEVWASYLFGEPVKDATVRVVVALERQWDYLRGRWALEEERQEVRGRFDDSGRFVAKIDLREFHDELAEHERWRSDDLDLYAFVTDESTGRTEQRRVSLRVTRHPIHVFAIDVEPTRDRAPFDFYVSAFTAAGRPVEAEVTVRYAGDDSELATVRTNRYGVARVEGVELPENPTETYRDRAIVLQARDDEGREGTAREQLYLSGDERLRVTVDETLHRPGEPIDGTVETSKDRDQLLVHVMKGPEALASRLVKLRRGRAAFRIAYDPAFRGALHVVASPLEPTHRWWETGSAAVVYPANESLSVDVETERDRYEPGDEARIRFDVRRPDGSAVEAALGVVVVDEALLARERTDEDFGSSRRPWYDWFDWEESLGEWSQRDILELDPETEITEELDLVAAILFRDGHYGPRVRATERHWTNARTAFSNALERDFARLHASLRRAYRDGDYPETLERIERDLAEDELPLMRQMDPWGNAYRPSLEPSRERMWLQLRSAGPDERFDTPDDFDGFGASWEYFERPGRVFDRAVLRYRDRTGDYVRNRTVLARELAREGLDLDTLRDPWDRPYGLEFGIDRNHYTVNVSADHTRVWSSRIDYFADHRAAIEAVLMDELANRGTWPSSSEEAVALLEKNGVAFSRLRDPWGRPYELSVRDLARYGDRRTLTSSGAGRETLTAVTRRVAAIRIRSLGPDPAKSSSAFVLANWEKLVSEESIRGVVPRARVDRAMREGLGEIRGLVLDPEGLPLPGTTVTLLGPGVELTTVSGADGAFLFPDLGPATYAVKAELSGFSSLVVDGLQVESRQSVVVDLSLSLSGIYETITVTGESPQVDVKTTGVSATYESQQVTSLPGPIATPRLRQHFPETLVWVPELVTNDDGSQELSFPLADNITTWNVATLASTEDGYLGAVETELVSFRPFFLVHEPPKVLTEGDRLDLPVVVRNYLEDPVDVDLALEPAPWYETTAPRRSESVGAGDAARATFPLAVVGSNADAKLRVDALSRESSDAVEKPVEVRPDGERIEATTTRLLDESAEWRLDFPGDAIAGSMRASMKIYPNLMSHVLESVDGILRRPYGCVEQQISAAYPAVLLLRYQAEHGGELPSLSEARRHLRSAYQRLEEYQHPEGGFSYWGRRNPNAALTAYAIRFLDRASPFVQVDAERIAKARRWLVSQQEADGRWTDSRGGRNRAAMTTASVAAALAEKEPAAARRALASLAAQLDDFDEPYLLANLALTARALDDTERADAAIARLRQLARTEGDLTYWHLQTNTPFYGWGRAGRIETTALAVRALSEAAADSNDPELEALVERGLLFLLRNKDGYGVWYSTQATIRALEAILAVLPTRAAPTGDGPATLRIVGGQGAKSVTLPEPGRITGPLRVDLSDLLEGRDDAFRIEGPSRGAAASLVAAHYRPWAQRVRGSEGLRLGVSYDQTELGLGDSIRASVTMERVGFRGYGMMVAEVGLPPGAEVDRESLQGLTRDWSLGVRRYELLPDRVVFYLWPRPGDSSFTFRFTPKFEMTAKTQPSVLYDYYNPDARSVVAPTVIAVR